jgi:hypothetical protein
MTKNTAGSGGIRRSPHVYDIDNIVLLGSLQIHRRLKLIGVRTIINPSSFT